MYTKHLNGGASNIYYDNIKICFYNSNIIIIVIIIIKLLNAVRIFDL